MDSADILTEIRKELRQLVRNPRNIKDYSRFHKDGKKHIGLATPLVRQVSKKFFVNAKKFPKKKVFFLCENLLKTEGGFRDIAFDWAFRLKRFYEKEDFRTFERWLKTNVDTWGGCDDLCTHAFGEFIFQFPEFLSSTKSWTKSKNRWFRRAAAVVLIYSLRKGKYLKEAFATASILLNDDDDLVQKGYGWMLKEASGKYPKEVFNFVMKNKRQMPRTALRYAIEKLPEKMRKQALAR